LVTRVTLFKGFSSLVILKSLVTENIFFELSVQINLHDIIYRVKEKGPQLMWGGEKKIAYQ
jgi:hypothetical protein